jgi:hypothetical protein
LRFIDSIRPLSFKLGSQQKDIDEVYTETHQQESRDKKARGADRFLDSLLLCLLCVLLCPYTNIREFGFLPFLLLTIRSLAINKIVNSRNFITKIYFSIYLISRPV